MLSYRYIFEAVGIVNGDEVVFDRAEFNVAGDHQQMVKFFEMERDAFFVDVDSVFGEGTYERISTYDPIPAEDVDVFLA